MPLLDQAVRWEGTSAYAIGPGLVYVNRVGRQARGTVADNAANTVMSGVRAALVGLKAGKVPVVTQVVDGSEAFPNAPKDHRPDLVVRFAPSVTTSSATMVGRIGVEPVGPNLSAATGAVRVQDGDLGAAFAVATFADATGNASLADVAPTVLTLLGVATPPWMDGHPWPGVEEAEAAPPQP